MQLQLVPDTTFLRPFFGSITVLIFLLLKLIIFLIKWHYKTVRKKWIILVSTWPEWACQNLERSHPWYSGSHEPCFPRGKLDNHTRCSVSEEFSGLTLPHTIPLSSPLPLPPAPSRCVLSLMPNMRRCFTQNTARARHQISKMSMRK